MSIGLEVPVPPGWLAVDLVPEDWEEEVRAAVAAAGFGSERDHPLEVWLAQLRQAAATGVLTAALLVEQDAPGEPGRTATLTVALGDGPLMPLPSDAELTLAEHAEQAPPYGELHAFRVPAGDGWVQRGRDELPAGGPVPMVLTSTTVLLPLLDDRHLVLTGTTLFDELREDVERVVVTVAHLLRVQDEDDPDDGAPLPT